MWNRELLAGSLLGLAACTSIASDLSSNSGLPPVAATPTLAPPEQPPSDDTRVATSPFVVTATDPLATFAADVDTASYDIFRRSILGNSAPPPAQVRAEEYLNYFHYDYPVPEPGADVPFTVSLSASAHITDARTKILRVGIQGAVDDQKRAASLVFLVDVSGSMAADNKLPLVKRVLHEALSVLRPSDMVSIVTYAGSTSVALPPTAVRAQGSISSAIDSLHIGGGGTNGASGIGLAYEQANKAFLEGGINHVLLCTDGDFNVGVTSDEALVQLIEQKRKSGVTLTALGVGERNNDAMMERVSNAGNGIYSVLYNEDQAVAYAHQRLLSTMLHIAKDVKIQVELNPAHVYAYRLIGYEDRAILDAQFREDWVDAGEIGSGHQVTALFELALTQEDLPPGIHATTSSLVAGSNDKSDITVEDLARVRLRWKEPGASEREPANEALFSLARAELRDDAAELDADAVWAIGVASLAEVLHQSPYVQDVDLNAIGKRLAPLVGNSPERSELISLWSNAVRLAPR
jgi:Ca-activated chloride channel family protein